MGNRGGQASGSGENHNSEGVRVPEEEGDGEESSSEPSRPSKKRIPGHRMKADAYPIDYIACTTTHTDLLKLRNLYNIPKDVLLAIPGKCDVPSRPPKGYVTLHLESFKLGARLPLQPYFARILGGMHLAPGQLHPKGWRVLSALFVLWERCGLGEPSLVEVKHLYQLRSSPKEAGWYYFMSSSTKRKPITGFPPRVKTKRIIFSLLGEIGVQRSIRLVMIFTFQRVLSPHVIYFSVHFTSLVVTYLVFILSDLWGLIKRLDDDLLLNVETALVNASTCHDLLSSTNLVGSRLVDVAAGMDNKILIVMPKKSTRGSGDSNNPPIP